MRFGPLRLFAITLLATGLLSGAVYAQTSGNNQFGSVVCPAHVACPGSAAPSDPAALAASANMCASQYFGGNTVVQYFDAGAGLDSSGCLSPTSNAASVTNGVVMNRQCCVVEVSPNVCVLRCELNKGS